MSLSPGDAGRWHSRYRIPYLCVSQGDPFPQSSSWLLHLSKSIYSSCKTPRIKNRRNSFFQEQSKKEAEGNNDHRLGTGIKGGEEKTRKTGRQGKGFPRREFRSMSALEAP